jgi:hypothetical protein
VHEPHRLQAKGRLLCFALSIAGERIEPIGPGTVLL